MSTSQMQYSYPTVRATPAALSYLHKTVTELIADYPIFGICLGHQMITHALGGSTFKLKFGHRGGNQPVKNIETGRGFDHGSKSRICHRPASIENRGAMVTEINLNDQTVEGLRHTSLPVFTVQYTRKPRRTNEVPTRSSSISTKWWRSGSRERSSVVSRNNGNRQVAMWASNLAASSSESMPMVGCSVKPTAIR